MARDSRNVVNRTSVGAVNGGGSNSSRREAGDPRQTEKNPTGMDMGMGGAAGGAMHDAAAMGGGLSDYAGPIGMNADPMNGAKAMGKMGEMELRKKKKNPMDIGGDYAGPESPSGFEGEAGNTFSKEGLAAVNQHYAQAQMAKEMQ
jgi:hypothetical protein